MFNLSANIFERISRIRMLNIFLDDFCSCRYVGAINTKHKELCLMAFDNGKAVLCEKPATMNGRELEEVLSKAKEKNVFYMEVLW